MAESAQTELEIKVRDITDEEVAFYEEHGWVKLDGLIPRDLAAKLLGAARQLMERAEGEAPGERNTLPFRFGPISATQQVKRTAQWAARWYDLPTGAHFFQAHLIRAEPFARLAFSKAMGRAAQRLINRRRLTADPIAVRYRDDTLICKASVGPGAGDITPYHQDQPSMGLDRVGSAMFWIALDEVTPEQGAMRFLDRSHRGGLLGPEEGLIERYPRLLEAYELSPPFHYQPGDATVHHQLTVHGAPENATTTPRWSFLCCYTAADCVVEVAEKEALAPLGFPQEAEARFPIVYP
jgi:hypothetical protein